LRKNKLNNILLNKSKAKQIFEENYDYLDLEIKLNELNLCEDFVKEYQNYDCKFESIDEFLNHPEITDITKFALYHLRVFSTYSFEEGEENYFNTEVMYKIFNKIMDILKKTNDNEIKVFLLIRFFFKNVIFRKNLYFCSIYLKI
jgi:hypothetical protein